MYHDLGKPVLPYSEPDIICLGWNESVVGPKNQPLYEGGTCNFCAAPVGARTDVDLVVERAPKAAIAGFFARISTLLIVSQRLLDAFGPEEVQSFGLRPIRTLRRSKYPLFEVAGAPALSEVAPLNGARFELVCWECPTCGHRSFRCFHPALPRDYKYDAFVCRGDLPRDPDRAFLVRDAGGSPRICMSLRRFTELAGALKGVSLWPSRLYCLDPNEVDRAPVLPFLRESNC